MRKEKFEKTQYFPNLIDRWPIWREDFISEKLFAKNELWSFQISMKFRLNFANFGELLLFLLL